MLPINGYLPSVFVLDPRKIAGQAPPYFGQTTEGTQLWYGVVMPTDQTIVRLELVDRGRDGTKQISVWMSSNNVLYLDFDGHLIGIGRGDGAKEDVTFGLVVKQ